jgi:hypothetical protein
MFRKNNHCSFWDSWGGHARVHAHTHICESLHVLLCILWKWCVTEYKNADSFTGTVKSYPSNRLWRPLGLWDAMVCIISGWWCISRHYETPKHQFHLNKTITHPDGCIGCIPGICWGCCVAGAWCCPCVISWPGGITPWDRGAPGAPGGAPLPGIATGGPETPM